MIKISSSYFWTTEYKGLSIWFLAYYSYSRLFTDGVIDQTSFKSDQIHLGVKFIILIKTYKNKIYFINTSKIIIVEIIF